MRSSIFLYLTLLIYIINKVYGMRKPITFLHFNDIYDLKQLQNEPKAGAAYFKVMLDRYRENETLTLFSGDVFAPSIVSRQYNGQNMILPLNNFNIDLATYGNHQLDYPIEILTQLIKKTNFPWLSTNMIDMRTGRRIIDGLQYKTFIRGGYKIGIFSLAQQQLLQIIPPQYLDICQIVDPQQTARKMIQKLKQQQKCDIIIALTHMLQKNDRKLALNVEGIDLNLGGHDHSIFHELIRDSLIIKSGADFKYFSKIQLLWKGQSPDENLKQQFQQRQNKKNKYEQVFYFEGKKFSAILTLVEINHEKAQIVPDPTIDQYIKNLYKQFAVKLEKVVIYTKYPIDLRYHTIRRNQSPYINFIAELFRHFTKSDLTMLHSGTFRQDRLIQPGPITLKTFMNFIKDDITAKMVKGQDLYIALQNSVSMYPGISGRYVQFSNVEFSWDDNKPPMSRIEYDTIRIDGSPLIRQKLYKVALRNALANGIDGYYTIKASPYAQDVLLTPMIQIMDWILDHYDGLLRDFKYRHKIKVIQIEGHTFLELNIQQQFNIDKIVLKTSQIKQQL